MPPSAISDPRPQAGRLDSWKEIAAYLRRGPRTVQRWERQEGLPVRRLQHEKLGSVYAFPHELDAWIARRGAARYCSRPVQHSVAVLPFADLTEQQDQACFCEGLAEEIAHALGRLSGVRTAGRCPSAGCLGLDGDFRSIGRRLGVGALLRGSVRRWGERLRIAVELVDAGSGFQQWSEHYDRTLGDALLIQDEIASCVTEAMHAVLAPREHAQGDSGGHVCHARGHGHSYE